MTQSQKSRENIYETITSKLLAALQARPAIRRRYRDIGQRPLEVPPASARRRPGRASVPSYLSLAAPRLSSPTDPHFQTVNSAPRPCHGVPVRRKSHAVLQSRSSFRKTSISRADCHCRPATPASP